MAAPYSGRTIDYLGSGLLAARPAAPNLFPGTVGFYYCTDVGSEKLTAWDGSVWADVGGGGGGFANPMTTAEDIIVGGVAGAPARLGKGADGTFLGVVAGALAYASPPGGSYTGTAGSITLTGSAFSIDATYVGQASITTLGTITTGTWSATAISAVKGGTGQTGYAVGDLLYASSTTALSKLAAGTDGYVLTLASGVPTWAAAAGGGGLTGFTASLETASPNNTVNASVMLPSGGTTNQDGVYAAKGSGAVQAQKADGTAAGGNKRGPGATDWQKSRFTAAGVASGDNSTIVGGSNNTASGTSSVAGGDSSVASGVSSVALGGTTTADGAYSRAGGNNSHARGRTGYDGWQAATVGGGYPGEAQMGKTPLVASTTNATQTTMTVDGGAASTANQLWLPMNPRFHIIKGFVQVFEKVTGDSAAWEFTALIKRYYAGAAMVTTCTPTLLFADAGAATWALAVDADSTNNALRVRVTGQASKTLRWVCGAWSVENGWL